MLTHNQIWSAIDALAARNGLSPSGLAKLAGLDPTTFNKSKRGGANGKLRWPSTESVSKVLAATNASMEDFVSLIGRGSGPTRSYSRSVPLIGMAQAGARGFFDDAGFPAGAGWDEIPFPELSDEHAYALEITGESMLPVYRDGDRIVVSPSASVRRGDRVVVKSAAGEVMAKQLSRQTAQRIELKSFNPAFEERSFALNEIVFMHRIIWASQ
ncbi:MAG TPA: helix-turn-helix transcriptional regulator [Rhizomicrobium sp.]|jgi:phage repressor protein C with HTH and peptisase S24 domain|nr:helix-turn-helix transcriptional regulator [Rhizomicrobium sp.]